jgi:hypothetical protein
MAVSTSGDYPSERNEKAYLETTDDLCSPQNLLRHVACSSRRRIADLWHPFTMRHRRYTLDEVSDRLYAVMATPVWRRPRSVSHACGDVISA